MSTSQAVWDYKCCRFGNFASVYQIWICSYCSRWLSVLPITGDQNRSEAHIPTAEWVCQIEWTAQTGQGLWQVTTAVLAAGIHKGAAQVQHILENSGSNEDASQFEICAGFHCENFIKIHLTHSHRFLCSMIQSICPLASGVKWLSSLLRLRLSVFTLTVFGAH